MAAGMQEVSATVEQINAGSENILSAIVNVNEQIDRGNDITSEILKKSVKYMQDTKNGQVIIVFDTYIIMYYNMIPESKSLKPYEFAHRRVGLHHGTIRMYHSWGLWTPTSL